MLTLCVKEPGGSSRELSLAFGTHTIGSGKNNDIVLSDDHVSKTHARITFSNNMFFIEKMENAGGVYLNDEWLVEKCCLENGAILKIGNTEIQVSLVTSDEIKTMVIFSPDEGTILSRRGAANSELENEDKNSFSKEEIEVTHNETILEYDDHDRVSSLNEEASRPGVLNKGRKWILSLVAASVFLIIAAFLYFQANPDSKRVGKSEPKIKVDNATEIKSLVTQQPAKTSGDDRPGRDEKENLESNRADFASNETVIEQKNNIKENTALQGITPDENKAGMESQLLRQGLLYYIEGKVELSLKELGKMASLEMQESDSLKTKAATYRKMISDARALYLEGEKAYKQGHPEAAFRTWARVLEIDHHLIGQKNSHFSNSISGYMCSEYAKRARRAFEHADYEKAYLNSQRALTIKPGLQSALEIKSRLSDRAEKLFGEAYILQELDPDVAFRKWREILAISSPDNKFHKKASRQLANY